MQVPCGDLIAAYIEVDLTLHKKTVHKAENSVLSVVVGELDAGRHLGIGGDGKVNAAAEQRLLNGVVRALAQHDLNIRVLTLKGRDQARHDGAAARVANADAQLALLIFGNIAELALHCLPRLPDRFGIVQKLPARVGELKRRAAHKECAAKLLFKSRNVGRERLLRDMQCFGGAGKVFLPREHEKIVKGMKIHGSPPFTGVSCRIYQF